VVVGYWEVGGSGGGVAVSTDQGKTFTLMPGMAGQSVRAIALSQSHPNILVAGALSGVYRSLDLGRTWQRISPVGDGELRNVESVAIDPGDPNVVYVGTWHLPWKTTDGGVTWTPVTAGMIDDSDVFTVTVDRRDTKTVYATACSGIYRSADGAAHWSRIRGIPASSRRTRSFAQDLDKPDTLYAGTTEGLWLSDDNSVSWRPVTSGNLVVNAILVMPGGQILLGTDGAGVIRSADGGLTWEASNEGFSERFVSRMVFDNTGRRVLVSTWGDRQHGGVLVAPGPTGPWRRLAGGLEGREVLSLGLAGRTVLAGTDDGLFASDWHTPWKRLTVALDGQEMHPRVVDLAAPDAQTLLAATPVGILRSSDGGATWTTPALPMRSAVTALATSGVNPALVMAATAVGFLRSLDGGATWAPASTGIGDPPHTLAFLPGSDAVVFATTRNGLYRSGDQGRTWARCGGGLPPSDFTGFAAHADGRTLYVSDFTWGGVFRSDDAGQTWRRLPSAGLVSERVWTVGVDPASPEHVLAASASGGLHLLMSPPVAVGTGSP